MTHATFYRLLADVILVVHFAFVAFVILGLLAVWAGRLLRWSWVRNFWFRLAHVLAIGIVAAEALGGVICPLTTWEARLRELAGATGGYQGSFIQHWVHRLIFFDASQGVFTVIYIAFFALVLASFWWVKPRRPARGACSSTKGGETPIR
jgi:hypothetical protein